jgi:hypothetical protein
MPNEIFFETWRVKGSLYLWIYFFYLIWIRNWHREGRLRTADHRWVREIRHFDDFGFRHAPTTNRAPTPRVSVRGRTGCVHPGSRDEVGATRRRSKFALRGLITVVPVLVSTDVLVQSRIRRCDSSGPSRPLVGLLRCHQPGKWR